MPVSRKLLAPALAAAAMVAVPAMPALAGTVVAVSGPSAGQYPVGTKIGDTQRISLKQGDTLTVLDSGGTRILRGPGQYILARSGAKTRNRTFASLTGTTRSRARTGAVRGTKEKPRNPKLWYVDVAASGTICLKDPNAVSLWRADTENAATYRIASLTGSNDTVEVNFPEKEMLGLWEAALQLEEGKNYTISDSSGESAAQVNFVFLKDAPEDAEGLADALISNNCMVQLEQMSHAMMEG